MSGIKYFISISRNWNVIQFSKKDCLWTSQGFYTATNVYLVIWLCKIFFFILRCTFNVPSNSNVTCKRWKRVQAFFFFSKKGPPITAYGILSVHIVVRFALGSESNVDCIVSGWEARGTCSEPFCGNQGHKGYGCSDFILPLCMTLTLTRRKLPPSPWARTFFKGRQNFFFFFY